MNDNTKAAPQGVAIEQPVPYGKLFTMLRWARQFAADERLHESELDGRKRRETNQDHADRISSAMQANEDRANFIREIDEALALIDGADLAQTGQAPAVEVAGERERFEAWADDQGFRLERVIQGDDYQDLRTQGPWEAWQARALASPATEPAVPAGWQPIETAPKGRKLIAGYPNKLGKWRTVMACYYAAETLDCEFNESGWADEGWYEESESQETIMPTDEEPTHWMPLPHPPKETPWPT